MTDRRTDINRVRVTELCSN